MTVPSLTKAYHHRPYASISPELPELSAIGKVVLIAGAGNIYTPTTACEIAPACPIPGSGVGEATAIVFAKASARTIILCGRRIDPLSRVKAMIESSNPQTTVVTYTLNVSKEEVVADIFHRVKEEYGAIDVCVNSAAHLLDKGTIEETTLSNY